jgi:glycerol kinase
LAPRGHVLAIDQGTSGTKALVVSADGVVLGSAQVQVRPRYGADGMVEQDPAELLASVVEAGRLAIERAGVPVEAVGLANQGETVLAWDRDTGRPLTDAIGWQDRRSEVVCRRLAGVDGTSERLAELTGLALDPYFAAPKMAWLRENVTRDGVVTTSDAWLVHALTGAFVTDASTASRTMLLDLDSCAWSAEALEMFGLGREQLPEVVDSAGQFGTTEEFGAPVPVTGLLVDQQAALLGEGCLRPGEAKCTFGTGAFLLVNLGSVAARSTSGLTASVAWRLGGSATYCLDGQVFTVASAVRWLVDVGVLDSAEDLDRVGSDVEDSGGVTFVPALAGLGGPWWCGDARGGITGLTLDTSPGHLVRALVDGIAAQVVALVDAVAADTGTALAALRVDGGLTRSRLLMQTQADLLQVPVEVFASADATALGVAAAARLGLDPGLGLPDAVPAWRPAAVYEPAVPASEAADRLAAFGTAVALSLRRDSS